MFILVFFMLMLSHPNTTFVDVELEAYVVIVMVVFLGRKYAVLTQAVALNIGLAVVIAVCALIQTGESRQFQYMYIYFIPDILATVLATLFFDHVYEPVLKRQRVQNKRE